MANEMNKRYVVIIPENTISNKNHILIEYPQLNTQTETPPDPFLDNINIENENEIDTDTDKRKKQTQLNYQLHQLKIEVKRLVQENQALHKEKELLEKENKELCLKINQSQLMKQGKCLKKKRKYY